MKGFCVFDLNIRFYAIFDLHDQFPSSTIVRLGPHLRSVVDPCVCFFCSIHPFKGLMGENSQKIIVGEIDKNTVFDKNSQKH